MWQDFIRISLLLCLCAIALIGDIKTYRIKNNLNFCFIMFGMAYHVVIGEVTASIIGVFVPLILFPFFMLRMMGAGDIKLFCALGSIAGFPGIISIIAYSVMSNGIIALVLLIINKNAKERIRALMWWIKVSFYTGKLTDYSDFEKKDQKEVFRYTYGICVGTFVFAVLERCGFVLF